MKERRKKEMQETKKAAAKFKKDTYNTIFITALFTISNLQLCELCYVYYTAQIKSPPHTPLQSLSISRVRCYSITT